MGKSQSIKMNKVLKENQQLRTEIAVLKQNINELEDSYNHLWEIATVAKHRKYSTNADKVKYDQLSIFNEAEAEADPEAEESEIPASESDGTKKSKRNPGKQKSKLKESNVTKTEEVHDISDEVKKQYGDRLKFIGYNIKNELIHHPAWYEYKEHKQCIYKLEGELNENGGEVFIKGTMPLLPLGKSYASASLLSKVITDKFDKGISFTRQERICHEQGVPIIKQTMANWMIQLDCNYYNVLAEHIRKRIASGSHSIGDETRVQVLKEEGKNPETES